MNTFTSSYPVKVYFGEGAAKTTSLRAGQVGKNVLLAYGGGIGKQTEEVVLEIMENIPNATFRVSGSNIVTRTVD